MSERGRFGTGAVRAVAAVARTDRPTTPAVGPRWPWVRRAILAVLLFAVAAPMGWLGGRLGGVQTDDTSALLPPGSESGVVRAESSRFSGMDATSAILVYTRPGGAITSGDRARIASALSRLRGQHGGPLAGPP